jgi:hypothetical protein
VTLQQSAHGDTPPPLRHADVLNGWSLTGKTKKSEHAQWVGNLKSIWQVNFYYIAIDFSQDQ